MAGKRKQRSSRLPKMTKKRQPGRPVRVTGFDGENVEDVVISNSDFRGSMGFRDSKRILLHKVRQGAAAREHNPADDDNHEEAMDIAQQSLSWTAIGVIVAIAGIAIMVVIEFVKSKNG
jgi:hypothetical protein